MTNHHIYCLTPSLHFSSLLFLGLLSPVVVNNLKQHTAWLQNVHACKTADTTHARDQNRFDIFIKPQQSVSVSQTSFNKITQTGRMLWMTRKSLHVRTIFTSSKLDSTPDAVVSSFATVPRCAAIWENKKFLSVDSAYIEINICMSLCRLDDFG